MTCSAEMVGAYFDGELDASSRADVDRHLLECRTCTRTLAELHALREEIDQHALYFAAPPDLRGSVESALRSSSPLIGVWWRYAAVAALILLLASLSWNVLEWRRGTRTPNIADAAIEGHVRSLLGNHLVDVPSSDQHTVKPWFAGRLDFSPPVKDLAAEGFPLVGGRADYLGGRRVAALVYQRRQHWINIFVWPGGGENGESSHDGYNSVRWSSGGMNFSAVSDVAMEELKRFRSLYEK